MPATIHGRAAVLILVSPLLLGNVDAHRRCRQIQGSIRSEMVTGPECDSPLGMCSRGRLTGDLNEPFFFTLSTLTANEDTASTGVMHYTGEMVVHSRAGDVILEEVGAFDASPDGTGDVAAVSTIVHGATGRVRIQGTFTAAAGGISRYVGQVCMD